MNKSILILAIVGAFVAGTLTTGSVALAHIDLCAQPSADSLKSVWHGLCDLQQQIDTIELTPGPQGATGAAGADGVTNVQSFHLQGSRTPLNSVTSLTNVNGLTKTFTLTNSAVVFVTSDVDATFTTPAGQFTRLSILLDSGFVSTGPTLDDDATALMQFPNHVSWSGTLAPGTHTISITLTTPPTSSGDACFLNTCVMDILIFD